MYYTEEKLNRLVRDIQEDVAIVIVWKVEDILSVAEDMKQEITEDQAREILHDLERNHDPEFGISWSLIRDYIANTL